MNQQQILFGLVCGAFLSAGGAYLATSDVADWSLFVVGLGLSAIALASRSQAETEDPRQLRPARLRLDTRSGTE